MINIFVVQVKDLTCTQIRLGLGLGLRLGLELEIILLANISLTVQHFISSYLPSGTILKSSHHFI